MSKRNNSSHRGNGPAKNGGTIEAQKIILRDENGKERIILEAADSTRIMMKDQLGRDRIKLLVAPDGEVAIKIYGEYEPYGDATDESRMVIRAKFGLFPRDYRSRVIFRRLFHEPCLALYEGGGRKSAELSSDQFGNGELTFHDLEQKPVVWFGAHNGISSLVDVNNRALIADLSTFDMADWFCVHTAEALADMPEKGELFQTYLDMMKVFKDKDKKDE